MTRGVLMFAHNNTEIDYLKIACANALMIKKNLQVSVTLVTDSSTLQWGKTSLGEEFINSCFEKLIEVDRNYSFTNMRNFSDTSYNVKSLQFYNCNHWAAYELSPYDETLFIDCDYLIMSDALSNCWGSTNDIMINHSVYSPIDDIKPYSKRVDDIGIRLYWATVIYFRKSDMAKFLFDFVHEIQENYTYYRDLYSISSSMYRNDVAFSIAIHTLNGFSDVEPVIKQLPIPALLMSWDVHDIQDVQEINNINLFLEKPGERGIYILTKLKNIDVHIMNKWAINRYSDKLIELYRDTKCQEVI
jgi:hypothetical protein